MKSVNPQTDFRHMDELEQVIEPLASYICASDKPKTAMMSVLAVLCREVAATNRAAAIYARAGLAV